MKKQKPIAIDKANMLLKYIRKHGEGRILALSKKFRWHKATVSRILIMLKNQGVLVKNPDGSSSPAEEWQ